MKKLCSLDDFKDVQVLGFDTTGDGEQDIFVIYRDGQVFAYRNSCPHTGAPLNWMPDQFLASDGALIQCQNHDAYFQIEDGVCVGGPCPGETLQPVNVSIVGRDILIDVTS